MSHRLVCGTTCFNADSSPCVFESSAWPYDLRDVIEVDLVYVLCVVLTRSGHRLRCVDVVRHNGTQWIPEEDEWDIFCCRLVLLFAFCGDASGSMRPGWKLQKSHRFGLIVHPSPVWGISLIKLSPKIRLNQIRPDQIKLDWIRLNWISLD